MIIFLLQSPFIRKSNIDSKWFGKIILGVLILFHLIIFSSVVRSANPLIWPLHNDTIHRSGRASDFYAIYHAALNLEEGLSPYEINNDGVTPYFYQFRYLPVVAEAGRAFTLTTPYPYFLWAMFLELYMGQFTFATVALCFLALFLPFFLLYAISIILKPITLAVVPAFVRNKNTFIASIIAGVLLLLTNVPIFLSNHKTWLIFTP